MFVLSLCTEDGPALRIQLVPRPMVIGRAEGCDVVVRDDSVSGRHLAVWATERGVHIDDLGSRNGTWVSGERLTLARVVPPGTEVRLGEHTRAVVELDAHTPLPTLPGTMVEHLGTGAMVPVRGSRLVIGPKPPAGLRVEGTEEWATLMVHGNGEVWLGRAESEAQLAPGAVFSVGSAQLKLHHAAPAPGETREVLGATHGYRLQVDLDGPAGPQARFDDPASGVGHTITAENRVVLVYVLARKLSQDRAAGVPEVEAGWLADPDVALGIWGRAAADGLGNQLNVLVWRVRKELEAGGFDPWCLEKRSRHLRLRAGELVLAE